MLPGQRGEEARHKCVFIAYTKKSAQRNGKWFMVSAAPLFWPKPGKRAQPLKGIFEAENIQGMNTRSAREKTYHLLISFRPEDEARLTTEAFRAINEQTLNAWRSPKGTGSTCWP